MLSTEPAAIELLSPARNLECGIAAIDHGADAVYIGAERFGARAAAGNSVADIAELCRYAHQFGARVYVTLNTILYDDELEDTRRLAWDLYHAGADAFIVQDTALLQMDLPPIPLHASTQMDNRSPEKVAWLFSLGFRQAVLARELSLREIEAIHRAVPQMPLEVFVHGALCVSYSGQCYASQYCFQRSANRGECAQFCRLPFSLVDGEGRILMRDRHLLSLRDMNRSAYLEEMMDAGVRSFKIEGRLKDVSYVKNVTAYYRQKIDAVLRRRPEYIRSSFGQEIFNFQPDPERSFSRGFTDYFLHGRKPDMSSPLTPKSRGPFVGTLKEVRRDHIIVSGTASFHNGDGLCYIDSQGRLQGFRINRAEGNKLYLNKGSKNLESEASTIPSVPLLQGTAGVSLYRSYDIEWERLMAGHTAERRMAVDWTLNDTPGGFQLTAEREDGTRCSLQFEAEHQVARADQTQVIADVLSKTGNTPYTYRGLTLSFAQPWFIPRSQIAEWRRILLEKLSQQQVKPVKQADKTDAGRDSSSSVGGTFRLPSSYRANVSNRLARLFYAAQGVADVAPALEVTPAGQSSEERELMTCRFCIRYEIGICPRQKPRKPLPSEPLFLMLGDGRRFRLRFDCRSCHMSVIAPVS